MDCFIGFMFNEFNFSSYNISFWEIYKDDINHEEYLFAENGTVIYKLFKLLNNKDMVTAEMKKFKSNKWNPHKKKFV